MERFLQLQQHLEVASLPEVREALDWNHYWSQQERTKSLPASLFWLKDTIKQKISLTGDLNRVLGKLGPGAQLSAPKKWTVEPRAVGPQGPIRLEPLIPMLTIQGQGQMGLAVLSLLTSGRSSTPRPTRWSRGCPSWCNTSSSTRLQAPQMETLTQGQQMRRQQFSTQ